MAKNPQNTLDSVKRFGRMKNVFRRFIGASYCINLVVDPHQGEALRWSRHARLATVTAVENPLHVCRRAFAPARPRTACRRGCAPCSSRTASASTSTVTRSPERATARRLSVRVGGLALAIGGAEGGEVVAADEAVGGGVHGGDVDAAAQMPDVAVAHGRARRRGPDAVAVELAARGEAGVEVVGDRSRRRGWRWSAAARR